MDMLPVFIIGLVAGAGITAVVITNLKDIPSAIKLASLEDTIMQLKDDIKILENTNQDLREKLKNTQIEKE